ncbi:helicase, putative [Eimeria praecox]|uniref:Helicase, putative n=1 Tax=Eimeria praecox TaxID=51316 RepID=U6H080_9EIME|nr:helicase, putative [Eimeria praecox]
MRQSQQQQRQQQEKRNLWWDDADKESQPDFSGAVPSHVEARRTPVQQHQQDGQKQQEQKQAESVGAEDPLVSPLTTATFATTAAAADSGSAHFALEPAPLARSEAAATASGAEAVGLTTGEVYLFLMTTPLTPVERHMLVSLWRRLSSLDPLLKSPQGTSVGPPLAALLEARWGIPVSLLSAAHTQRCFLRWLYTALQQHQEQLYLRAQQQSQRQQQQEHQQQPPVYHEDSRLNRLQAEAFKDLLQSMRGQFDLREAAAARMVKQQPQEMLQELLQQWKRSGRSLEEGDLLSSTYRMDCGLLLLMATGLKRMAGLALECFGVRLPFQDLRTPELWFPAARQQQRRVYLSLGPPNSGKTHRALEALLGAPSGCYLGPLRLLATEVYGELRKKGVRCSLITGPSKIIDPEATHVCSTVEAAPLDKDFSVGVIDEVQLMGDPQRGPAWTRAFLGLRVLLQLLALPVFMLVALLLLLKLLVKELHVCGEEGAEPLVESLLLQCGDIVVGKDKKASLASVKVETEALPADWVAALQPGDCLLAFSVNACWRLKGLLSSSGVQAALLYGHLPPEVRLQQTRLFNEAVALHAPVQQQQPVHDQREQQHSRTLSPDEAPVECAEEAAPLAPAPPAPQPTGETADLADKEAEASLPPYSVLIATDAIGLGVNLSIRRIIFTSMFKYDGTSLRRLEASEVRQLAYRAGRFGGPWGTQGGLVSALHQDQLDTLRTILEGPGMSAPPLKAAALLPESWAFELFAHFAAQDPPECTAVFIQKFASLLHTRVPYFIPAGALHRAVAVAALLRDVPLLPAELYIFCMAPVSVSRSNQVQQTEQQQEGADTNAADSEAETASSGQEAAGDVAGDETSAAATGGTPSGLAAAALVAAASISLPMQAALRSFAVSLAATRVVPLPSPFRVVRKASREHQQQQLEQNLSLWSADEGPCCPHTAAGVGYFDGGVIGASSDTEETEATPAETIEALRAWETIYQVLDLYLWLAEKLPTAFVDVPVALTGRSLAADVIMEALQREKPLQGLGAPDELRHSSGSRMLKDLNAVGGFRPQRSRGAEQHP